MFKIREDPRVTSVGRIARRYSIDELPQLFNVLKGDMSLIGPRPLILEEDRHVEDWARKRLALKPGMTGLAQVHGLRESSAAEQKTRFDLQYVVDPYLLWDVSLLLQTVWTLLLRVFRAGSRRGTYNLDWDNGVKDDVISNAHSAQSSAD